MENHGHLIDLLNSKFSHYLGFFSALGSMVTAGLQPRVNILEWVPFQIGNIDFPVGQIITLLGALTATVIAVASIYKTFHLAKSAKDDGA